MFYDDDADLTLLDGKTVAIIGFGSQGHAHAQNLKDSGVNVVVGLREGSRVGGDGARPRASRSPSIEDAASRGDIVMMLVPDELHREVYENHVRDGIAEGNMLLFGHGFSVLYGEVTPPDGVDVALAAPKGPGHLVRRQYLEGSGVPGLIAINAGRDRQRPARSRSPTPRASAARAAASSRRPSRTRPRPTSSASRPCSAAARPSSSRRASKRSSRPATRRRWRTSSACTSSSSSST